jgi:adenylate kinase
VNIILIGAQGSGKGTQAARLANALGVRHVASGDLFRKAVDEQTELGLKAKEYLDRGELVPDDLTIIMILSHIREPASEKGVLLDGFPRNLAQAEALDKGLESMGRSITCTIYLSVPREVLLRRLSGRYICKANQHVYNIETNPPKVSGKCDIDGSELYQRPDDQGEAVQTRLDTFYHETIHLLDYYRRQHKLTEVNGNQGIDQVHHDLIKAVHNFSKGSKSGSTVEEE